MQSTSYNDIVAYHERSQWISADEIVRPHVAEFGRHFAVISLIGEVHHAKELTQLRGKWTAVLADTGERAFITHVRKQPLSLKEIEELGP